MPMQAIAIAKKVGEVCARLVYEMDACNTKQILPPRPPLVSSAHAARQAKGILHCPANGVLLSLRCWALGKCHFLIQCAYNFQALELRY